MRYIALFMDRPIVITVKLCVPCSRESVKPVYDLFPVHHRPELLHVLFLAPYTMVKQPTMFVYADAEQGVNILSDGPQVAHISVVHNSP